jgi:hypothetical protein
MLLKSGNNLKSSIKKLIDTSDSVTLFSAYIKSNQIRELNSIFKLRTIVVRWQIEDLLNGSSDLNLYDYCVENNIALYRNTRLHMKAIWDNKTTVICGSANYTNKGIGEHGKYNYELNVLVQDIQFDDVLYFQRIIWESEYIDDQLYSEIVNCVNNSGTSSRLVISLDSYKREKDFFLISELPLIESPELLYEMINNKEELEENEKLILAHDLILYDIEFNNEKFVFMKNLKIMFNSHPFIVSFKNAVKSSNLDRADRKGSMSFGMVRSWFAQNTTTVPTPKPFELSEYVRTLYTWICYFDEDFTWSIPGGHSQVIQFLFK